jgi:predicted nuclease of predicted toxin-antitoxin system
MLSAPPPRVVHLKLGNLRLGELRDFLIQNWPDIAKSAEVHELLIVITGSMTGVR